MTNKMIWYTKWFASFVIVIAVGMRSAGELWHIYDLWLSLLGSVLWLLVSIAWKDRALIMLNTVITVTLITGIFK